MRRIGPVGEQTVQALIEVSSSWHNVQAIPARRAAPKRGLFICVASCD